MVQGKNFTDFAINQLQPYFVEEIGKCEEKIRKFNNDVKDMFGQKLKVKQKSKGAKPFGCPHCKVKSATVGDLKMHLKHSHTSLSSRKSNKKSKRQKTLNEDTSILDDSMNDSDIISLEESIRKSPDKTVFNCNLIPCDFKAPEESNLSKHIADVHIPVIKEKYLQNQVQNEHVYVDVLKPENRVSCDTCEFSLKA